ncbi:P-loop containing nucleoside triphosphate hydrolases superfamily protein [Actinidia rufa]|uniref:P-loop containing nucleoside triphosphate hydrolases superfamily protein n=1 Tax=Actinidia rufa TaxID=165716 RepID=A0A7J0EYM5_9ERIC|nr:P-loop containing nucleoside triphosphate hydrolases superfamily protein [Actinidia rufa]
MTVIIDEFNGLTKYEMFEASKVYLRTKISPSMVRLKVFKAPREENFSVTIHKGEMVIDAFEDIQVTWKMICTETEKSSTDYSAANIERRSIELSFQNKNREKVLSSYLPYVLELSKAITEANTVVKLHSLGNCKRGVGGGGGGVLNLDHPSTFDTLAMDPKLKNDLVDDLNRFVKRRKFYKRVGKARKRGYLLYGPPGKQVKLGRCHG